MTITTESDPASVMVVGGAGFLGSHLVDRLLADGVAVDVVDDLSTGSLSKLAEARRSGRPLTVHTADASSDAFADLVGLRRPSAIYQLAALPRRLDPAGSAIVDPGGLGRAVEAVSRTIEAAHRHSIGKIVVAIPADEVYGHPTPSDLPVKERPLEAASPTGAAAIAIVELLRVARHDLDLEFTALAIGDVYGPRQRPDGGVVAALAATMAAGDVPSVGGDGRQARDFVFVDDAVDALARARTHGSGLVVNVGTGVATSLRQLWAAMAPEADELRSVPAPHGQLERIALASVRARIHLGWAPWTDLADGLAHLADAR